MFITTSAASQLTGLSESWLRHLARAGSLPAHKSQGRWRFDREGLIGAGYAPGPEPAPSEESPVWEDYDELVSAELAGTEDVGDAP